MRTELYYYKQEVELSFNYNEWKVQNMAISTRSLTASKGVTNIIDFSIRDSNRKPKNLSGTIVTAYIVNRQTGLYLLTKNLVEKSSANGHYQLILTPAELANAEEGWYTISVTVTDAANIQTALYQDESFTVVGDINIKGGIFEVPPPVINILPNDWMQYDTVNEVNADVTRYKTGAYKGDMALGYTDGIHTISYDFTNYTGRIWVQGSVQPTIPPTDAGWFDIPLTGTTAYKAYNEFTGTDGFTLTTASKWIRFIQEPAKLSAANTVYIANTGNGYQVNDEITLAGGAYTIPVVLKVLSVNGSGGITSVSVEDRGQYTWVMPNPVSQASTTGSGTSATFNLTWEPNSGQIDKVLFLQ